MSSSRAAYHHGDLAGELERAAMRLLEEKPATDISLREVARAADVSHNAPYHHFADRLGLLKVLGERSMTALVADVRTARGTDGGAAAALGAMGLAYITFAADRPHAFDAIFDPTVCVPGAPTVAMAPLIEELESMLTAGPAEAGLDRPVDADGLWGLMHGLATLAASGHLSREQATDAWSATVGRLLAGR